MQGTKSPCHYTLKPQSLHSTVREVGSGLSRCQQLLKNDSFWNGGVSERGTLCAFELSPHFLGYHLYPWTLSRVTHAAHRKHLYLSKFQPSIWGAPCTAPLTAEHSDTGRKPQMPLGTAGSKSWHAATLTVAWPWGGFSLWGGCSLLCMDFLHLSLPRKDLLLQKLQETLRLRRAGKAEGRHNNLPSPAHSVLDRLSVLPLLPPDFFSKAWRAWVLQGRGDTLVAPCGSQTSH